MTGRSFTLVHDLIDALADLPADEVAEIVGALTDDDAAALMHAYNLERAVVWAAGEVVAVAARHARLDALAADDDEDQPWP
jgi:hypothetical protein